MMNQYAPACACPDGEYHDDTCEVYEPEFGPPPSPFLLIAVICWILGTAIVIASV
jgi:hypothetical protein